MAKSFDDMNRQEQRELLSVVRELKNSGNWEPDYQYMCLDQLKVELDRVKYN